MASIALVEKAVAYPPLSEMSDRQRREFHEALLDADTFEDLPGILGPEARPLSPDAPS